VTGQATGKRQYGALTISKSIDKTTPLLIKALCEDSLVDEAEFRFFRPSPMTRTGEHFYTVLLTGGHIASVDQLSEEPIAAGADPPPMMEEVSFQFPDVTWTYEDGGVTHHDHI
jgi:type VI secretion system secreted protein Hcp